MSSTSRRWSRRISQMRFTMPPGRAMVPERLAACGCCALTARYSLTARRSTLHRPALDAGHQRCCAPTILAMCRRPSSSPCWQRWSTALLAPRLSHHPALGGAPGRGPTGSARHRLNRRPDKAKPPSGILSDTRPTGPPEKINTPLRAAVSSATAPITCTAFSILPVVTNSCLP